MSAVRTSARVDRRAFPVGPRFGPGSEPQAGGGHARLATNGMRPRVRSGDEEFGAGPDQVHTAVGQHVVDLRRLPRRERCRPAALDQAAQRHRRRDLHRDAVRRATDRLELGAAPSAVLADLAWALPGRPPAVAVRAVAVRLGAGASAVDAADALGWTTRSLHRRCVAAFGYGPAVLRRVLRFRRAVALLHAGIPPAGVAARAGHADQPHLSREVRAWAGVSPGQVASGANRSTVLPSGSWITA